MSDCLDLIPLYGVALYLFLRGRQPAGLDRFLNIPAINSPVLQNLAHNALRWGLGLGLVVLAFDEKLVHPQLALHLLSDVPDLNFLQALGVDNASFVFCAGVVEVVLGLLILSGCLPRLATLLLAGFFTITTLKFGSCELIGHMPFYGIILSILLRGSGEPQEERHPASDGTPAAVAILPAALSSTTVRKTRQKSA